MQTGEEKLEKIKQLMNDDEEGKKVINQCIEKLVTHTIQYTRRQIKWIKHRIMINSDSEEIKNRLYVFEFDEFTSENFKEKAIDPATSVLSKYFEVAEKYNQENDKLHPIDQLANDEVLKNYLIKMDELMEVRKGHFKKGLKDWNNYYCDVCKKEIYGELNWSIHNNSKKHKRSIKSIEKAEIRDKYFKSLEEKKGKEELINTKEDEKNIHEDNDDINIEEQFENKNINKD